MNNQSEIAVFPPKNCEDAPLIPSYWYKSSYIYDYS